MKILITGVSSGIGRILTKKLILQQHQVWGVARRKNLLSSLSKELNSSNLHTSSLDISSPKDWKKLIKQLTKENFIPEVIIFNAAIWEKDLDSTFNINSTKKMMDTNFYGAIRGIALLLPRVLPDTQFIAISSLSSFKGSGKEGVGYASSKAALSIAFESLYQKYKNKFIFKTIFFGPVKKIPLVSINSNQAADFIIKTIKSKEIIFYHPPLPFFLYKCLKLLPSNLYFPILSKLENLKDRYQA